jgi:hypothetical protein
LNISKASVHISLTGLLAGVAPSIRSKPPIVIGSKKDEAAAVARAASQILVIFRRSEPLRLEG